MDREAVIDLEMKLAFQEDLLQKLDDALVAQQHQIKVLEDQVRVLSQQIQRLSEAHPEAEDERPPHY